MGIALHGRLNVQNASKAPKVSSKPLRMFVIIYLPQSACMCHTRQLIKFHQPEAQYRG